MPRTSPTVRRRRLGQELRALRESKSMTVEHVAKELDWSPSKVSRIETTAIKVGTVDLRALLDVYGVTDDEARKGMLELGKESREVGWWMRISDPGPVRSFKDYIGFEAEARQILTYEQSMIPGLLQTESYARAMMRALYVDDRNFEDGIQARLTRQELLTRSDDPVKFVAIVDEAALRRPAGGVRRREVMREQIERLIELSDRPNIAIRVLPFDNGLHPGMSGAFTILELPHPDDPNVVYVEAATVGVLLNDPEDVRLYNRIFDGVQQEALGRQPSEQYLHDSLKMY
ncbi:helix-turn-helix domain-containing protein [Cryptosporangium phraense]|uniref:Helix-turn-helix domain-containing protein n=1 Tax=Cryptosporangium phraense TaxID=2593070 RepID=A0A545ALU6_9ACTN|nr:helix-turn-helix transcriptional regulator [Cryptosporangium phraense]TQS42282.1 helix-turn-helix domain-containing protein [Cryptosporangium phraense]